MTKMPVVVKLCSFALAAWTPGPGARALCRHSKAIELAATGDSLAVFRGTLAGSANPA